MAAITITFLVPLLILLTVLLVLTARALWGSVSRKRVEGFAKLHSLTVTAGNGNQIIAYRATTRRWRTAGLLLGVAVQIVLGGHFSIQFWWVLAGWFAGAIVAELRVAQLAREPRAAASLTPRRTADYLPAFGRWAVPAALAACVGVAVLGAARNASGRTVDAGLLELWTVLGVAVGAATLASQRYVLRRPQPHVDADRLAADDAIRSRSMHVLAGAGMTLVLYCVLGQLAGSKMLAGPPTGAISGLLLLGNPILGRILAYWPWSPDRLRGGPGRASA
jgi:hypothetical protein